MNIPTWLNTYGEINKSDKTKEDYHLVTFFNYLRENHPGRAGLAMHIKNEGKRTYSQAQADKAKGMLSGAADIIILSEIPFVCEMKAPSGGRFQKGQLEFLQRAQNSGCFVCLAFGCLPALEAFNQWEQVCK